jgi:uncharacterized protein YqjF (DUF2071 family)
LGQEIELRRASKGLGNPLEASYWHLPKTPFHMTLQKVTGLVIGLTRTMEETTIRKYFQFHGKSRGILRNIVFLFEARLLVSVWKEELRKGITVFFHA